MFRVKEIGDQGKKGYGKFVRLIRPGGAESVYGHLSEILVKQGEEIGAATPLGKSGNTGFSTGPHTHWGYRPAGFNANNGFAGYVDQKPLIITTPVPGARVSQWFGSNPALYKPYNLAGHNGIDYAVPVGTLVYPGQLTTDKEATDMTFTPEQIIEGLFDAIGEPYTPEQVKQHTDGIRHGNKLSVAFSGFIDRAKELGFNDFAEKIQALINKLRNK